MAHLLWEQPLREYLCNGCGRATVLKAFESYKESLVIPVFFDGLTIADEVHCIFDFFQFRGSEVFQKCHELLTKVGKQILEEENIKFDPDVTFRFRLEDLGISNKFLLSSVPKEADVGQLVQFCGTVVKITQPRMVQKWKLFRCATCKTVFRVIADVAQNNLCQMPLKCANRESCEGVNIKEIQVDPVKNSKDYQEIKVQEKVGKSLVGKIPRSVWVVLDEDQIDVCNPGDDVIVIGDVIRRWNPLGSGPNGRTEIEYVLVANNVKVNNFEKSFRLLSKDLIDEFEKFWRSHNDLEGRLKIIESFCPQVYGLYSIKLAASVVLCGGLEKVDDAGTKVRGEPHLLLVGDPGTGKSQILKYASKLVARSVMTTGIGSTSAGLTATASRDGGQWHLEAGALVLADGGIACIDEFNSIKEVDRVAIHEAMEQQSISVAKAGMVCQLRTRCSVLACTNPKGKYDPEEPVTVNIGMASPLLSRFDLVYLLLDSKNPTWDKKLSSYILQGKDPSQELSGKNLSWNLSKLQAYFSYCKQFKPTLTEDSSKILSKYFQKRRMTASHNMSRSTVRLLQSAVRLAEAHARLMCHREVTVLDAVTAVILLDSSIDSTGALVAGTNPLHSTFPIDPVADYLRDAKVVLTGLGLNHILAKEMEKVLQRPSRCSEDLKRICDDLRDESRSSSSKDVVTNVKKMTKEIKRPTPVIAQPEIVNSHKRSFLFEDGDRELEDLDVGFEEAFQNVSSAKKTKRHSDLKIDLSRQNSTTDILDNSISFSQECLVTSTQKSNDEKQSEISTSVSMKTLSKLRAFKAPPPDDLTKKSSKRNSDEGLGSSVASSETVTGNSIRNSDIVESGSRKVSSPNDEFETAQKNDHQLDKKSLLTKVFSENIDDLDDLD